MRLVKYLARTLVWLVPLAAIIFAVYKHQALYDWYRLRDYTPSQAVADLATQDTMTSATRKVFYINHPDIVSDGTTFRADCLQKNEQTIVLGCYRKDVGIYIYSVTDSRLNGVEQVTAAHETLHAEYDRLSPKERTYVDGLLMDYYNHDLHDQRIIDDINAYKTLEPNDVVNEMHSVFGTEIADLPAPLETYYQQYFTNRTAITTLSDSYEDEFTSRQNQVSAYDKQLATLMTTINTEENNLGNELTQINSDRDQLDREKSNGQYSAYNSGVASFNSEVAQYNSGVTAVKTDIDSYNAMVATRNALAGEITSLTKSIDSNSAPQPTQ